MSHGQADDLKKAVYDLGMSSPAGQIISGVDKVGRAMESGVNRVKGLATRARDAVLGSPAPKKHTSDIYLPPAPKPANRRKVGGGAYGKGRGMSRGR